MFKYEIPDDPKMLRETLCAAQYNVNQSIHDRGRRQEHSDRLQRLIDACDKMRPIGVDGKHGNKHTENCGCEDKPTIVHLAHFLDHRPLCWDYKMISEGSVTSTEDNQVTCLDCRRILIYGS